MSQMKKKIYISKYIDVKHDFAKKNIELRFVSFMQIVLYVHTDWTLIITVGYQSNNWLIYSKLIQTWINTPNEKWLCRHTAFILISLSITEKYGHDFLLSTCRFQHDEIMSHLIRSFSHYNNKSDNFEIRIPRIPYDYSSHSHYWVHYTNTHPLKCAPTFFTYLSRIVSRISTDTPPYVLN